MKTKFDSKAIKCLLGSYIRAFIGAAVAAYSAGERDLRLLTLAGAVAVIGPAIRAVNPNDPMFGVVADAAETEIKKVATRSKKKA